MPLRLFFVGFVLELIACNGVTVTGNGRSDDTPPQTTLTLPAFPSAGPDREVLRGYSTQLCAAGTTHPNGKSYTLQWTQTAGEMVLLSSERALCPSFLAPLTEQDLGFRLSVDDGTYRTSDDVIIRVRAEPHLKAPSVAAASDRMLSLGESALPDDRDIASALATDTTTLWSPLVIESSTQSNSRAQPLEGLPNVFRLTAERYGMGSTPDYLVLLPFDPTALGAHAPTASLVGPTVAAPSTIITLDASGTADPNGDLLTLRWERLATDSACAEMPTTARFDVAVPSHPQEVTYRVFARDARFESSPAELTLAVSTVDGTTPTVAPGADQRTRPGRSVRLDALGGAPNGTEVDTAKAYIWHQTVGPAVELTALEDGRIALFTAPALPAVLAFGVVATIANVESAPAVLVVEVMADDVNTPPNVYLSSPSANLPTDDWLLITATIQDPEGDSIAAVTWSAEADVSLTIEPLSECPTTGGQVQARVWVPTTVTNITVHTTACDEFEGCNDVSLSVDKL